MAGFPELITLPTQRSSPAVPSTSCGSLWEMQNLMLLFRSITTKLRNCHVLKNRFRDETICLIALCSMIFPLLHNCLSSFSPEKHLLRVLQERKLKLGCCSWRMFCILYYIKKCCIFTFKTFNFSLTLLSLFYLTLCFEGYVWIRFNWIHHTFSDCWIFFSSKKWLN